MNYKPLSALLVSRKTLCRLLGDVSISHVIRLEHCGQLAKAKVQVGKRAIRYDIQMVKKLIDDRRLI